MRFLFCILFCCIVPSAQAEPLFGLSMHDAPKYNIESLHLEYANPDAPKGGTLKRSAVGTFDTLNPYTIKGQAAQNLNLFYDRLMARVWDEPFTLYPLIAEKIEIFEERSGFRIYINPNSRFHDGSPITADDILFSFETLKEHGRPNMQRIYKLAETVTKLDDQSIEFHFGDGHDRETIMIFAMMPILSKTYWEGRDFNETTLDIPVSNGPYKIKSVDAGRQIIYERDPEYWARDLFVNRGHYNFDKIVIDYYRDDNVALEAFLSGDLNWRQEFDISAWTQSYTAARQQDFTQSALAHQRPEKITSLIFNTRREPFNNIKIRKALSLMLDFEWLNKNLYFGEYKRIKSFFPNSYLAAEGLPTDAELQILEPWRDDLPESIFKNAWSPPITKDQRYWRKFLKEADNILQDAGWIVKDGQRIHKDTRKAFTFEILLSSPDEEKLILSFIRNLKRLGITAQIRIMDSAAFQGRLSEYDYDMVLYFWRNSLSPGTEQVLYWSCESANIPSRWNFAGICHEAVDYIVHHIASATTREELQTYAHALDRILTHSYYAIPLFYAGKDFVAHDKTIHYPSHIPLYGYVLETWWQKQE